MVNNLLAMQETQVRSLDREDPLEEEIAVFLLENLMDRGAWRATVHCPDTYFGSSGRNLHTFGPRYLG